MHPDISKIRSSPSIVDSLDIRLLVSRLFGTKQGVTLECVSLWSGICASGDEITLLALERDARLLAMSTMKKEALIGVSRRQSTHYITLQAGLTVLTIRVQITLAHPTFHDLICKVKWRKNSPAFPRKGEAALYSSYQLSNCCLFTFYW